MNEDEYIGSKEEEMDAEGAIVTNELQIDTLIAAGFTEGICHNCADRTYVKLHHGLLACRMCAERYPLGMPF